MSALPKLSQAIVNAYAAEKSARPKAKVLGSKKANYLKVDKTVKRVVNLYQKGGDVDVPELLEAVNKAIPAVNEMIDFMEKAKEQGYSTPVYNKLTSSGYTIKRKVGSGNGETRNELVGSGYLAREGFKNFRMSKFSMVDKEDSLDYELLKQDLLEAVSHITEIAYSGETNKTQIQKKQKMEEEAFLDNLRNHALKEIESNAVYDYDWDKTREVISRNRQKIHTFWDAVHAFEDRNETNPDYSSDTALSVVFELTFRPNKVYNLIDDTSGVSDKNKDSLKRSLESGFREKTSWNMGYETIASLADLYYDEVRTFLEGRRYL